MPNHCYNSLTITGKPETIQNLVDIEFDFEKLHPVPEEKKEDWYEWNCEHWGTKWNRYDYTLHNQGEGGFEISFTTAWGPPYPLLEFLLEKFPDLWIKCQWDEEGGEAGIWIGFVKDGKANIQSMEWQEMSIEERAHRFESDSDSE
jgi:hypothetical protein